MIKKPKVKIATGAKTDVLTVSVVLLKIAIAAFVLGVFILTLVYSSLIA